MIRRRDETDRKEEAAKKEAAKKEAAEKDRPRRRAAVRPFWSGTISFGLINVPVQLFPATRRTSVSLRMLADDGTPLRRRYYCPAHDRILEPDEIVRGFELETGEHVVVTDEELEAAEPKKSREIDLRRFVDLSSIPPLHFERAYFLTPRGDSNKAYRLLAEVMRRTGRAGIATFVMRNREYLVAILSEEGILRAETLRFEEEIRGAAAIGLPEPEEAEETEEAELERFEAAIDAVSTDALDPDEMTDDHAEQLLRLAQEKRARGEGVIEADRLEEEEEPLGEDEEEVESVDLLETIRMELRGGDADARGEDP